MQIFNTNICLEPFQARYSFTEYYVQNSRQYNDTNFSETDEYEICIYIRWRSVPVLLNPVENLH